MVREGRSRLEPPGQPTCAEQRSGEPGRVIGCGPSTLRTALTHPSVWHLPTYSTSTTYGYPIYIAPH
eukprot:1756810-Prymnesium_polylepis.1